MQKDEGRTAKSGSYPGVVNYSATHQETLTGAWVLKHFKDLIVDNQKIFITNHADIK